MWAIVVVVFAFALSIGATTFSSWWLKTWFHFQPGNFSSTLEGDVRISMESQVISADSEGYDLYRNVYAGMIAIIFLASLFRTILFVWVFKESLIVSPFNCCTFSHIFLDLHESLKSGAQSDGEPIAEQYGEGRGPFRVWPIAQLVFQGYWRE
jgi:hypothetical protein